MSRRGSGKRLWFRLRVLVRAMAAYPRRLRRRPPHPERILVVSRFLLGDTLMLAPLLATLQRNYPQARRIVAVQGKFLPLFAGRPYGVEAVPLENEDMESLLTLAQRGPFDLALVPGDNRHALLARAAGGRWIAALAGDRPEWKNRICDELLAIPTRSGTIFDAFTVLGGPPTELEFAPGDWSLPRHTPLPVTVSPTLFVMLHVGASSPSRRWPAALWWRLAETLAAHGLHPVWSAGPGEEFLVREVDPEQRFEDIAGRLGLGELWEFIRRAQLLISPDTGVVHIAKLTGTPTVCLYGRGGEALLGKGRFFRSAPLLGVVAPQFRDRSDGIVFKRRMPWIDPAEPGHAEASLSDWEEQFRRVLDAALRLVKAYPARW